MHAWITRLLVAAALFAALPLQGGNAFPLTNTRYGVVGARQSELTTNGRDVFLMWSAQYGLRMTKLVDGDKRVGRQIYDFGGDFDVAWTGSTFVVVIERGSDMVVRVLDANGDPIGAPATLISGGARHPRLASDGRHVLLLYSGGERVEAILLSPGGAVVNPGTQPAIVATNAISPDYDVVANGNGFMAVTASQREVKATRFSAAGAIVAQQTISSEQMATGTSRFASIATSGTDALAVWSQAGSVYSARIDTDGTIQAPRQIGSELMAGETAVAWNADHYTAAYTLDSHFMLQAVVVTDIDAQGQAVERERLYSASIEAEPSLLFHAGGGRLLGTWMPQGESGAVVADLSAVEAPEPEPATWGASYQNFGAAVSSTDRTLVFFSELLEHRLTHHLGVRMHTGEWSETTVHGLNYRIVAAATDGVDFAAVTSAGEVIGFDRDGRRLWKTEQLHFQGSTESEPAIVWNGAEYVMAFVDHAGDAAAVRISRSGTLSQPVRFTSTGGETQGISIATNGTNLLVVWGKVNSEVCFPVCDATSESVRAIRLNRNLDWIGGTDYVLATNDAHFPQVVWSGGQYRVVWSTPQGIAGRNIPATGAIAGATPLLIEPDPDGLLRRADMRLVALTDRLALWWRNVPLPILSLSHGLTVQSRHTQGFSTRDVFALPDGRTAFVGSMVQPNAPFHGAPHLYMQVDGSTAPLPDPPVVAASKFNGQIRVRWTPPPQPVAGYRLQYKVDDGVWLEMNRWFGPEDLVAPWPSVTAGRTYSFRVLAFSEGGMSSDSNVSTIKWSRRRAVR